MTHKRQTAREALVTLLTGLPLTGSRVYNHSPYLKSTDETPCIGISTGEEEVDSEAQSLGDSYHRSCRTYIDIFVDDSLGNAPQVTDAIAEDIEEAIKTNPDLSGVVLDLRYAGTEDPEVSALGEKVIVTMRMVYLMEYEQ